MALSLLMLGAKEKTEANMKNILGYHNMSNDEIYNNFINISNILQDDGTVKIANKVYLSSSFQLSKEYQENSIKYFNSESEALDFGQTKYCVDKINQWIESKTNNKIKDVIQYNMLTPPPVLILINAIHFKAKWKHPFNKNLTKSMDFWLDNENKKETVFMSQTIRNSYLNDNELDAQVLKLDYNDSDISMIIVLPNKRDGLNEVEEKLKTHHISDSIKKMRNFNVRVTLPKFKIEYEIDLTDTLIKV